MQKRLPGSREEDSWLSERQLAGLTRADQADELGSPVPTQVVSNGEYFPLPQTLQQSQVELRIAELATEASRRLGMSRRRFLASSGGMAAAFIAMNEGFGRFFDVNPLELMGSARAQGAVPRDLFVFDDQLHMIRESFSGPLALRPMSQSAGAVRDWVNGIAGSTRLLAHGQIFPGRQNLGFMQQQIDQFHPDSWKGYNIAYTAKLDDDPQSELKQWRLDDEQVAYPSFELIRNHRKELAAPPGFFNICIHKGLPPAAPDTPAQGSPSDLPKVSRDWPEFNFIIYHACFGPRFFDAEALQAIRAGKLRNGVPDLRWLTEFAQNSAPLKNVYAEIGTTFASCVVTFPSVCAHMLGQLMKYLGPERIVFGSDSLWYGAPQWQIEAFWRFQIPQEMAKKYGYPQLSAQDKRKILGLNSARLYKLPASIAAYQPVPGDYEARIPDRLKATLNYPGHSKPGSDRGDKLSKLREDYLAAGGHPSNRRYGWIRW